jgi:hypothetical protein
VKVGLGISGATRFAAAALGATAALVCAHPAVAGPPDPDQAGAAGGPSAASIISDVAGQVTHGSRDDSLPLSEQLRIYHSGERLDLTCGYVVLLTQAILAEHGIPSRQAAVITRDRFNATNNGHTMIEVRAGRGWNVFDISTNRQPRDSAGKGISVVELVAQQRRNESHNWRRLASDQKFDFSLKKWYSRVLGVPLIEMRPGHFGFRAKGQRKRLEAYYAGYHWLGKRAWQQLVGAS